MKPTGIFERVRFLESRLDRMEIIILEQDKLIRDQKKEIGLIHGGHLRVEPGRMQLAQIAADVAADNGLTLAELQSSNREFAISHARQYAMMLMFDAEFSTPQIGRFFGRDHSTVAHGIKAARERVRRLEEGRSE